MKIIKRILYLFLSLILLFILMTIGFLYYKRMPNSIAKTISGLALPYCIDRVYFDEQWCNFNGNGYSSSVFNIPDGCNKNIIIQECINNRFDLLPMKEDIPVRPDLFEKYHFSNKGFYYLEDTQQETKFIAIDTVNNKIFIFLVES
jgi:hypothetical protein